MKNKLSVSGLVYSTEAGRMCPACREPVAQCRCKQAAVAPAGDGLVRISRQTKGRGGKVVTQITGFTLDATALTALARQLKTACGSGGTVKDGEIEVQGNHVERLALALQAAGYKVKRTGG